MPTTESTHTASGMLPFLWLVFFHVKVQREGIFSFEQLNLYWHLFNSYLAWYFWSVLAEQCNAYIGLINVINNNLIHFFLIWEIIKWKYILLCLPRSSCIYNSTLSGLYKIKMKHRQARVRFLDEFSFIFF